MTTRIAAFGMACVLGAFFVIFIKFGMDGRDGAMSIICYLLAAGIGCGIVLALCTVVTGESPL